MKEMMYTSKRTFEILDRGFYNNYQYAIISYGSHPCCYVALEKEDRYYEIEYDNIKLTCHGSFTYSEHGLFNMPFFTRIFREEFWVIGWDYAHAGDYIGYIEHSMRSHNLLARCKKWTTQEMLDEVHNVIDQLNFINTRELLYS